MLTSLRSLNWQTILASALISLTVWLGLGMWQRHNAQHQLLEQQMREVAAILNELLKAKR